MATSTVALNMVIVVVCRIRRGWQRLLEPADQYLARLRGGRLTNVSGQLEGQARPPATAVNASGGRNPGAGSRGSGRLLGCFLPGLRDENVAVEPHAGVGPTQRLTLEGRTSELGEVERFLRRCCVDQSAAQVVVTSSVLGLCYIAVASTSKAMRTRSFGGWS